MQKNKKMIIGGAVVASCLAAGAIFAVESNETQFDGEKLDQSDYEFMSFTSKYNKHYRTKKEYKHRKRLHYMRGKAIKAHNDDPETTSTCGHNYMSDYTDNELGNMRGYDTSLPDSHPSVVEYTDSDEVDNSAEVNWVTAGKVTPVQNQGQCGACWTFSASGAISSAIAIANKTDPVDYSEQQIVDCDTAGHGCNGGLMTLAFTYVESHPLQLSSNYPYVAKNGSCTNPAPGPGKISS